MTASKDEPMPKDDSKESGYANIDARNVRALADRIANGDFQLTRRNGAFQSVELNDLIAQLTLAAQHLESMDQKLSRRLEHDADLTAGIAIGARRATERSNILKSQSKDIRDADGEIILRALESGSVRKVPKGQSGLPKGETIDLTNKPSAPARKGFRLGDL